MGDLSSANHNIRMNRFHGNTAAPNMFGHLMPHLKFMNVIGVKNLLIIIIKMKNTRPLVKTNFIFLTKGFW